MTGRLSSFMALVLQAGAGKERRLPSFGLFADTSHDERSMPLPSDHYPPPPRIGAGRQRNPFGADHWRVAALCPPGLLQLGNTFWGDGKLTLLLENAAQVARKRPSPTSGKSLRPVVEPRGLEPLTPCLPTRRLLIGDTDSGAPRRRPSSDSVRCDRRCRASWGT